MKIVQALYTAPFMNDAIKVKTNYYLCYLSSYYANRLGYEVYMYTDDFGFDLIKDIPYYKEVNTKLNVLKDKNKCILSLMRACGKFIAMKDFIDTYNEPFVFMDTDVFIKKDFIKNIPNQYDCVLQCKESRGSYIREWEVLDRIGYEKEYRKTNNIYNVGFMLFNNINMVKEFIAPYFKSLIRYENLDNIDNSYWFDFVFEQEYMGVLSKKYKIFPLLGDEKYTDLNITAIDIGYQHLQGGGKYNKEIVELLKDYVSAVKDGKTLVQSTLKEIALND
jgi:hypothetical protein